MVNNYVYSLPFTIDYCITICIPWLSANVYVFVSETRRCTNNTLQLAGNKFVCIRLRFSNQMLPTLTTHFAETHSLFSNKTNITYVISLRNRLAQTTHNTFRTLSNTQQSLLCLQVAKSTENYIDITTVTAVF
jgi:hypothetical protein